VVEDIIEEFDKVVKLNPNNPDYHNNKRIALDKLKKNSKQL